MALRSVAGSSHWGRSGRICRPILVKLSALHGCSSNSNSQSCGTSGRGCWNSSIHSRSSSSSGSVLGLASAKKDVRSGATAIDWTATLGIATLFTMGVAGVAFHDGLWTPLLRDAQSSQDAAASLRAGPDDGHPTRAGLLRAAAGVLADGKVAVIDRFLSSEELARARGDLNTLSGVPGMLQLNPKAQAGNLEIRTDRVCYIRDEVECDDMNGSVRFCGDGIMHCHRLLRAAVEQLEIGCSAESGPFAKGTRLLVPQWTQLAVYGEGGGFYSRHVDGLTLPWMYWLLGPVGLFLFLKWGALRRRAVTAILYLNDEAWSVDHGGALRCWAKGTCVSSSGEDSKLPQRADGTIDIVPIGGRLVLFDSHAVEHEVRPTQHERWAITLWIHR